MVDRILTRADEKPVQIVPGMLIVWGLAAAVIDAGQQAYFSHAGGVAGIRVADGALLAGILYSIILAVSIFRNCSLERVTHAEVRMGRMMAATWFTVFVAAFAQPHVFAGWGGAAVWSMGAAITMLIVGFSGERRGLAGGMILLASILVANYITPHMPGYTLAAGFILGYAVPGVLFLSRPPRGEV
jgi:hypothetical protein